MEQGAPSPPGPPQATAADVPHAPAAPPPSLPLPQGAQKDMGLHMYAARFAAAGLAVFAFDYRTFGGSEGEPRNWISPKRHLEDWRAALDFVKSDLNGLE